MGKAFRKVDIALICYSMAVPLLVESSITILFCTGAVKSAIRLCGCFFPPLLAGVRVKKIMM